MTGCERLMFGSFHCGKIPIGAFRGKWKLWLSEHAQLLCDDCRRKPPEPAPRCKSIGLCGCPSELASTCRGVDWDVNWYCSTACRDAAMPTKPAPLATDQAALERFVALVRKAITDCHDSDGCSHVDDHWEDVATALDELERTRK